MTTRELALSVLERCQTAEQYSNIALDTALRRNALSASDRKLLTALVYGVIEKRITLDYWIDSLAERSRDVDLRTREVLRLGLYQLAFLDRIPSHAAVNETVSLSPKRTRAFVNAILRAFLRKDRKIPLPSRADPVRYLSVAYSFSPEICKTFLEIYGEERTEALLAAFDRQPPLTLRVNTLRIDREKLLSRLLEKGIDARPTAESEVGILVRGAAPFEIEGFDAGDFFVQDEASQLCIEALDAKEGMAVLDACACPGSKSFGAAIDMKNTGSVTACDLHANKLSLVRGGAERLGITTLLTEARDARAPREDWEKRFDRVLCDVPCSGLGVFSKKPELRYKELAPCASLPEIQYAILKNCSSFVKEGGLLVYSTCTLLPSENGENVSRFLEEHQDFSLLRERTLFPDLDGTDGFYFAVLQRQTLA